MVSLVHAGILATLRQLARSYTTAPLPDWMSSPAQLASRPSMPRTGSLPVRTTSTWLSAAW